MRPFYVVPTLLSPSPLRRSSAEAGSDLLLFQLADRLVGIYKTDNATKSVTINPSLVAGEPRRAYPSATTVLTWLCL